MDELLAGGMPREEAVKVALAEFGDAAGLAAEFGSLSRNRKRRWLMRVTTFSAAAIVLFAVGLAIFWPGRNAGPGMAAVVAQDPADTKPKLDPDPMSAANRESTTLESKLNQRIDAEFEETPLKDVVQSLADKTGIQFYIKAKLLEEAGVNVDTSITKNFRQIRLSTFLDLMLDDLQLVYCEKDDLIVITTPEDAESVLEIRVYDCRDLLGLPLANVHMGLPMPGPGPGRGVPSAVPPGVGPPGAGLPPGAGNPGNDFPPSSFPPRTDSGVPGSVPPRGAAPSLPSKGVPSGIMPQFGGGATPGGMPPGAMPGGGGLGGMMGGMGMDPHGGGRPQSEHEKHADALIDLITTNVDPEAWSDVGGPSSISAYHGLIVVTTTAPTHKKVERVLDMLREAAGLEVGGTKKVVR